MSISYDEHDIVLYELIWEINPNSVKVRSVMTNKKQEPWQLSLEEYSNLFQLITLINHYIVLGKLCYDYKTKNLAYEI